MAPSINAHDRHAPIAENRPPDKPLAMVNGQAVRESELVSILIAGYGRDVLDELVLREIVRQQGHQSGLVVTAAMVQQELDQTIEKISPGKTPREQKALFDYMLKKRNMSQAVFKIILEKQLTLRKLVDPNVSITEKMLQEEYQRQYGKKVIVRQIVVSSFRTINQVKKRLENGESFSDLVQTVSEDELSLSQEGISGPFSPVDQNIPQALRDAAFALKQSGAVSPPVRYYDDTNREWWAIIRLEKEFPADTTRIISEVTDELHEIIHQRIMAERMMALQNKLKKSAQVKIVDPRVLRPL
ncbi:MAG: peptidylprolyl isomerase [Phycisphaerae bacterium]|nr:peptidylprolyl isomerase [Phycisphaerae bacterium]